MTGLRWSRRTTTTIAEELAQLGIAVSPNTVARLLHDMGYSLQVNQKQISTSCSPHRNLQFEYLAELRYPTSAVICPSSAWTVKNANSSAIQKSRSAMGTGPALRL